MRRFNKAFSRALEKTLLRPDGVVADAELEDWFGSRPATISGATYTLLEADHGKTLLFSDGCTIAVPPGLPNNFVCGLVQAGGSQIEVDPSDGVTVHEPDDQMLSEKQWVQLALVALGTDEFLLSGRTAAA